MRELTAEAGADSPAEGRGSSTDAPSASQTRGVGSGRPRGPAYLLLLGQARWCGRTRGPGLAGERVPAGSALAFLCRVLAGRPHRDPLRFLGVGLGHPLILSEHPRTCLGSRPREPGRVPRALRALSGVLSRVPACSRARGCRPRAGRGQTPPGAAAGRPGRVQRRDGVLRVPGVLAADAVEPSPQRGR